jgi:hypothetical protein
MVKRFVMFVLAVGLSAPVLAQDARAVLQASLKAMGGENLKTIQYSGAGWSSAIGQTYGLGHRLAAFRGGGLHPRD